MPHDPHPHAPGGFRTRTFVVLLLLVVAMVNFPVVHTWVTGARIAAQGVDTTAVVLGKSRYGPPDDPHFWVSFRLDEEIDPLGTQWSAEVRGKVWGRVEQGDRLPAQVLPDEPAVHRVKGEVRAAAGLWLTLGADVVLLALLVLLWRFRHRGRTAYADALGDVTLASSGDRWEDLGDGTVTVAGELVARSEEAVELLSAGRRVRVLLGEHSCTVGCQQPALVSVRLHEPTGETPPTAR